MIKKYTDLIEMLEKIFGKGSFSRTIGTRTNVVRFPKGKQPIDPTKSELDVEGTAIKNPDLAQAIENSIADRMGDITKMNDQELLTYTANVRRLVNFKEPPKLPEADVVKFGSGEEMKGKGLEELIEKEGLVASPKTSLGSAQFNIKRAEQEINKVIKENDLDSLLKGFGKDQLSEIRLHNQGLVRAVTRQILSEDIRAGKIKSLDLEKLGTSREPIDYFRKIYGEDALEQLDSIAPEFNRFYTEKEAADFAKTKFKFEPDETRLKGSMSYEELEKNIKKPEPSKEAEILNIGKETDKRKTIDELIDEYNANFDRTKLTDEEGGTAIGYSEFQDLQKRNEEIAKALEEKGIKSTIEEEIKPEGIVIPFRKKFTKPEPEEKADGGRIGFNKGKRVKSSIDKLLENLNKKIKGKKSMESVDPKTGEVTVPKRPIRKAEEPTGMTTMDPEPEIVDEKSIKGGFDFNDSEIKAQMEKAMQEGNKRSKEMRAMGLDPAKSKDYDEYIKIKEESGDKDFNKYFEDLEIKTKFKGVISDDLLQKILMDDDPQRKAEVIATIEQGLTMQEKGMRAEEIVDILKNAPRTKQAEGGIAGLL